MKLLRKAIVAGETGVGKSALLTRFTDSRFSSVHDPTIGVEFGSRTLQLGDDVVKLQVWDLAGIETFRTIVRSFYSGTFIVIIVQLFEGCALFPMFIFQLNSQSHSEAYVGAPLAVGQAA